MQRQPRIVTWTNLFYFSLISVLSGFFVFLCMQDEHLKRLSRWIDGHKVVVPLFLTLVCLCAGFYATVWKILRLRSYALSEMAVGCVTCFILIQQLSTTFKFSKLLGIASGIYLIGRGSHNLGIFEEELAKKLTKTAGQGSTH